MCWYGSPGHCKLTQLIGKRGQNKGQWPSSSLGYSHTEQERAHWLSLWILPLQFDSCPALTSILLISKITVKPTQQDCCQKNAIKYQPVAKTKTNKKPNHQQWQQFTFSHNPYTMFCLDPNENCLFTCNIQRTFLVIKEVQIKGMIYSNFRFPN